MIKKFFFSFLVFLLLVVGNLSLAAPAARAQENQTWYSQDFKQWWTKVYDEDVSPSSEIFGERYTAAQVQWVIYGLFAFVINSTTDPETTSCLMNKDLGDCAGSVVRFLGGFTEQNEAVAQRKGFLAFMLSDKPLSGITYFKNIARKINLVPEAYAQTAGFGFTAIDPILPLWRAVRNATYALLVVATLALAFMIMFRVKISPQTVISIQSALPKLVGAIILITFSYAIAGLLVDLMYLVIGFLAVTISSGLNLMGWSPEAGDVFGFLTEGPLGTGIVGLFSLYLAFFGIAAMYVFFNANGLGGVIAAILTTIPAVAASLIVLIAVIILFVVLLVLFFRVGWMMIKAFANILLLVLAAPLQILLGTVSPGGGFNAWLRSYLANLAVFPTVGVFFVLAYVFLLMAVGLIFENFIPNSAGEFLSGLGLGIGFLPAAAIQHQGWPPLLIFSVQTPVAVLFLFVSVVVITLIPRITEIIQGLITGKPFAYGTAIGEAFGPIAWGGKQAWASGPAQGLEIIRAYRIAEAMKNYANADTLLGKMIRRFVPETIWERGRQDIERRGGIK